MTCDHQENDSVATEKASGKGWTKMDSYNAGGCTIEAEVSSDETAQDEKLAIVELALAKVSAATQETLSSLHLYLSPGVRCIAFMAEANGGRDYQMFLGDKVFAKTAAQLKGKAVGIVGGMAQGVRGVADQRYDKQRKSKLNPGRWVMSKENYAAAKANAKAEAVVVHEIGHIFHERQSSTKFWEIKANRGEGGGKGKEFQEEGVAVIPTHAPPILANQVSQYAGTGVIEYVAEVFTGLVYGTRYSDEVIALYVEQGGPAIVTDDRTKAV